MEYRRQGLQHIIERALKRNPYTADQPITVVVLDEDVLLYGTVNHADLIPEAVATVEAIAPFLRVHCRLRVRWVRALT